MGEATWCFRLLYAGAGARVGHTTSIRRASCRLSLSPDFLNPRRGFRGCRVTSTLVAGGRTDFRGAKTLTTNVPLDI